MGFFQWLQGKKNRVISGTTTQSPRSKQGFRAITDCDRWTCPNCGGLLGKTLLGSPLGAVPGKDANLIGGTATCPCGAQYDQSDVYAGVYDVRPAAVSGPAASVKTPCIVCGRATYKGSAFDLSTSVGREAALRGGMGLQCQNGSCGAVYCFPCTMKNPRHPVTGGKACRKCGGAMDNA